jgi:6-pyruvoyltetrahydropterin/6-carboxytetrahydropterin synthase
MISIFKDFIFDAAHFLPYVPEGHKCRRLHGHTYHLRVFVKGPVANPEGWIMDFGDLKKALQPVLGTLDHHLLNEIPGLENPTSEVLVQWLAQKLTALVPNIWKLELKETPESGVVWEQE